MKTDRQPLTNRIRAFLASDPEQRDTAAQLVDAARLLAEALKELERFRELASPAWPEEEP